MSTSNNSFNASLNETILIDNKENKQALSINEYQTSALSTTSICKCENSAIKESASSTEILSDDETWIDETTIIDRIKQRRLLNETSYNNPKSLSNMCAEEIEVETEWKLTKKKLVCLWLLRKLNF